MMIHVFSILVFLSVCFSAFILWCYFSWKNIPEEDSTSSMTFKNLSVIISARNEEKNILACLNALSIQNYPFTHFEILVVDDHSEDETAKIVLEFISQHPELNINLIKLTGKEGGSKKAAITFAISKSRNDLILLTDADSIVPPTWIKSMQHYFLKQQALFIAGPVSIDSGRSMFTKAQALEFMGLVGIAAAGISRNRPVMCNGANLMFTKTIFEELKGFDAPVTIASGDDTQLLLKVSRHAPERVFFLKDSGAVVTTQGTSGRKEFVQQRKRWAGKIPFALTPFTIVIASLSWLTHAFLLLSLAIIITQESMNMLFILSITLIFICELLLLNSMASFFHKRSLLWLFLPVQFFYWIYIVLIGAIAPFGTFQWKGRVTR